MVGGDLQVKRLLATSQHELEPVLGMLSVWGIAVGLVISGMYFGWRYGWASAGTLGFLVTTLFVALMYTTFIFSFTELSTSIPHAGGPFAYARWAFGPTGGLVAGYATLVAFVFAPPAIALAIGACLGLELPGLDPNMVALGAYVLFITLNALGVAIAAMFELVVTVVALARAGYLPAYFAKVHPRFKTPVRALIGGGVVGMVAVFSDQLVSFGGMSLTANIVTMAVLGALVMYIVSMASLFKLRQNEPMLDRPYRAPFYPVFPAIALICGVVCLFAVVYFNPMLTVLFLVLMAMAYLYFRVTSAQRDAAPQDAMLGTAK